MHSTRMRTARLLPVSPSMDCSRGMYLPGDVPDQRGGVYLPGGGCICQGVYLPRGGCLPRYSPPPVNRMTGAKILPCPELRLRAVNIYSEQSVKTSAGSLRISYVIYSWRGWGGGIIKEGLLGFYTN